MDRVPIVLLHGVGLDHTMWRDVIDLLDRPAVAIDLAGHGEAPLSLEAFSADIAERMPSGPVHVVGFSLGALVGQHLARYRPHRVASLTCVSAVCRRTAEERAAVEDRLERAGRDFAATIDASLDRWFPDGAHDAERAELRTVLEANDPARFIEAYRVFATADADLGPELGAIEAPLLAITGESDPGSTPEMTARLVDAVPHGRARVLPGIRHMLPLEAPRALVAELNAFIDDVEGKN